MPHFDLLWLASGYEGLPNSIMEAMAAACRSWPPISAGNRELVVARRDRFSGARRRSGRSGPLCPQDSAKIRPWPRGWARPAGSESLAEFTVEAMVDKHAALYRELLGCEHPCNSLVLRSRERSRCRHRRPTDRHVRNHRSRLDRPAAALAPDVLARMTDVLAHRGPGRRGQLSAADSSCEPATARCPAWPWGIGGCRSSTWPADISRCRTKTARSGSSSTAKSTTTASCASGWKAPATASARTATPKTIVHLYEDEGLDFVQHLNGMFALAIWDADERRLVAGPRPAGQEAAVLSPRAATGCCLPAS